MRPEDAGNSPQGTSPDGAEPGIEYRARKIPWVAFWLLPVALLVLLSVPWQIHTSLVELNRRMRGPDTPVLVRVPDGATAAWIAGTLAENRVVPSAKIFLAAAKREGVTRHLRAGEFLIPGNRSPREIARYLAANSGSTPRIALPEGSTLSQVVRLMVLNGIKGSENAETTARDPDFLRLLGVESPSLEGHIQPGSYPYQKNATARGLLIQMVRAFQTEMTRIGVESSREVLTGQGYSPLSPSEVVILASIIQREAGPDPEKPLVSEVFHNRLLRKRKLESCATVRYITGDWKEPVRKVDLESDSPYNTYKHRGLPPGPICSVGESSLLAALHPAKGDLMYFVARGDGTNFFSETYEEHLEAIEKYLGPRN